MAKNQKGIAHILLLVVLVVVAFVGIGYYAYKNGQIRLPVPEQGEPNEQEKLTPSQNQPSTSPSLTIDETANWKKYENLTYDYTFKYPEAYQISSGQFDSSDKTFVRIFLDKKEPVNGPHFTIIVDSDNKPSSLNTLADNNYQANLNHKGIPAQSISKPTNGKFNDYNSVEYSFINKGFISPREEYIGYEGVYKAIWVHAVNNNYFIYYTDTSEIESIISTFKFLNIEISQPQVTTPLPNSKVTSPLVVKGKVPANWMFEGQFPVRLLDSGRNLIATGVAKETTPGSWTKGNPVEFQATITFTTSATSGFLVLNNDNPSGLPQNSKSFEIPVSF